MDQPMTALLFMSPHQSGQSQSHEVVLVKGLAVDLFDNSQYRLRSGHSQLKPLERSMDEVCHLSLFLFLSVGVHQDHEEPSPVLCRSAHVKSVISLNVDFNSIYTFHVFSKS